MPFPRELFCQYRGISHELDELRRERGVLDLLQSLGGNVSGDISERITALSASIGERVSTLLARCEAVDCYISSVDDPFDRAALIKRFIHGKTWRQIAFELGEMDEQYPRKRCARYFGRGKAKGGDSNKFN